MSNPSQRAVPKPRTVACVGSSNRRALRNMRVRVVRPLLRRVHPAGGAWRNGSSAGQWARAGRVTANYKKARRQAASSTPIGLRYQRTSVLTCRSSFRNRQASGQSRPGGQSDRSDKDGIGSSCEGTDRQAQVPTGRRGIRRGTPSRPIDSPSISRRLELHHPGLAIVNFIS